MTTADYKTVLADNEVEAVWVLTPNHAHYTITMDALRAGKHVMCEKPITVNYKLSLEMADEANRLGKILNIGVCNRYHKSVELLREMNKPRRVYHTSVGDGRKEAGYGYHFGKRKIPRHADRA